MSVSISRTGLEEFAKTTFLASDVTVLTISCRIRISFCLFLFSSCFNRSSSSALGDGDGKGCTGLGSTGWGTAGSTGLGSEESARSA